jgi:hypothetical protein
MQHTVHLLKRLELAQACGIVGVVVRVVSVVVRVVSLDNGSGGVRYDAGKASLLDKLKAHTRQHESAIVVL